MKQYQVFIETTHPIVVKADRIVINKLGQVLFYVKKELVATAPVGFIIKKQ